MQCIAAGSHILNHELESEQLRPFAVQVSKAISRVRVALKEQCLTNRHIYSQKVGQSVFLYSMNAHNTCTLYSNSVFPDSIHEDM